MNRRNPDMFIYDILDSIYQIKKYTENIKFTDFESNRLLIDAVVRNLEIIGEAARNVPQEIKDKNPEIPWKRMIGIRNIVIH